MANRKVVFLAGPISKGDLVRNIQKAHHMAELLTAEGYAVIVPHGSCFWGCLIDWLSGGFVPSATNPNIPYETFIESSTSLVCRADAVLRLPGESSGADREVQAAKAYNIPVFDSVEELLQKVPASRSLYKE